MKVATTSYIKSSINLFKLLLKESGWKTNNNKCSSSSQLSMVQCSVCLRKITTLCRHALFEFLSGRTHKRTLVAGKEELNFEDLQEGNNKFIIKVSSWQFYNWQEEVLNQKSPKLIDRFVFNYLAVDNAGQTADNKHTGSMIFPFFLLASKTDKPLGDDTFQNQSVKLIC